MYSAKKLREVVVYVLYPLVLVFDQELFYPIVWKMLVLESNFEIHFGVCLPVFQENF